MTSVSTSDGPVSPDPSDQYPNDRGNWDRSTTAGAGSVSARTDDMIGGIAYEYVGCERLHVAKEVDEVRTVLRIAERAARTGSWLVGYVAYEAAPAFDPVFAVNERGQDVPLVVMAEFAARRRVPLIAPCEEGPGLRLTRQGGSCWFRDGVHAIRDDIAAGGVYQVNLTDRVEASFAGSILDLYRRLAHAQIGSYNVLMDLGVHAVACASPELFFTFDDRHVVTRPMKGTARRRPRLADDEAAALDLARSEKDRAENVMIVDLLRNDLSRIAALGGVEVPSMFDVERFETVWQMTSQVTARTRPGTTLEDVFAALFPCGSVTGAPKAAAMRMIRELEPWPRGVYCGAIGTIGPGPTELGGIDARFAVGIRTAEVDTTAGVLRYGSGGGITWDSSAGEEDDELEAKCEILVTSRPSFDLLETMRVDTRGVANVERHLARLAESAAYFGFTLDLDEVRRAVTSVRPVLRPHRLRVVVTRSGSIHRTIAPLLDEPTPVRIAASSTRVRSDDPLMCHKTTHRLAYQLALAQRDDVDDVLMVNERNEVIESTVAAVLFRRAGHWWTPPLSAGGLASVGRQILVDAGDIRERELPVSELEECEGFELVSSLRGRRPALLVATSP